MTTSAESFLGPVPADKTSLTDDERIEVAHAAMSQVRQHSELASVATRMARVAAARCLELGTDDASLCHGAAGALHIFNRLAQRAHDPRLADLARRWFARTLESIRRRDRTAVSRRDPGLVWTAWRARPGLMNGAAGVALALAAASSRTEPTWDRLLLLSLPRAT